MNNTNITQFQGESRKEAIINHFSLDIEEEDEFFQYMEDMGYTIDSPDDILTNLHLMWLKSKNLV